MGVHSKFTIRQKREIVDFYETHGPRTTEEEYGLKPFSAPNHITRFKYQLAEVGRITITEFVKISDMNTLKGYIATYNSLGITAANAKYGIKIYCNFNLSAVRYLISIGLKIKTPKKSGLTDDMIGKLIDAGMTKSQIVDELGKTFNRHAVNTRLYRYRRAHHLTIFDHLSPELAPEQLYYIKNHTVPECSKLFNINEKTLYQYFNQHNIEYKHIIKSSKFNELISNDIELARSIAKNLTVKEIADTYETNLITVYKLCYRYNIDFKRANGAGRPKKK